jgi:hypothetical protein
MPIAGNSWSATIALTAFAISTAHAETLYNYTGNVFDASTTPYSASNRVTGSMTLAQPLKNNVTESVTPVAFTFTDGKQTISNSSPLDPNNTLFKFTTDATGNVINWAVDVEIVDPRSTPNNHIMTCGIVDRDYAPFCTANDRAHTNAPSSTGYNGTPGKWAKGQ